MKQELPCWRLVLDGVATLKDLESTWSLDDVARMNALLDFRSAVDRALVPKEE